MTANNQSSANNNIQGFMFEKNESHDNDINNNNNNNTNKKDKIKVTSMNPFKIETSNLSTEMNEINNQRFDYISSDDAKNFHSAEPWHSNFEFGDTSCNDQNMEYLPEILKNQTFIHESLIAHCQSLENILTKHPFMQSFNAIACELIEQGVIACDTQNNTTENVTNVGTNNCQQTQTQAQSQLQTETQSQLQSLHNNTQTQTQTHLQSEICQQQQLINNNNNNNNHTINSAVSVSSNATNDECTFYDFNDFLETHGKNSDETMIAEKYQTYCFHMQRIQAVQSCFIQQFQEFSKHLPNICGTNAHIDKRTAKLLETFDFAKKAVNQQFCGNVTNLEDGRAKKGKKRGTLPKAAIKTLKKWLFNHFNHPYPNEDEKSALADETGLTVTQVNYWFINARVRIWRPLIKELQEKNDEQSCEKIE